jgi:hypothetical protein
MEPALLPGVHVVRAFADLRVKTTAMFVTCAPRGGVQIVAIHVLPTTVSSVLDEGRAAVVNTALASVSAVQATRVLSVNRCAQVVPIIRAVVKVRVSVPHSAAVTRGTLEQRVKSSALALQQVFALATAAAIRTARAHAILGTALRTARCCVQAVLITFATAVERVMRMPCAIV